MNVTPQVWDTLATILQDYGLPLVMLGVFGWLIITGRLVTGRELNRRVSSLVEELKYRDSLRLEERDGRLKAEERLDRALETMRGHTDLLRDIEREIVRGQGRGSPPATA